jgi:uncharacterized protein (DUF433 family)
LENIPWRSAPDFTCLKNISNFVMRDCEAVKRSEHGDSCPIAERFCLSTIKAELQEFRLRYKVRLGAHKSASSNRLVSLCEMGYCPDVLDWNNCAAVERDREKVGGAWLFKGTRVPVKALFENLEEGATVDDFLSWFPGVTRAQVLAVLEFAEQSLAVT